MNISIILRINTNNPVLIFPTDNDTEKEIKDAINNNNLGIRQYKNRILFTDTTGIFR